MKAIGRGRHMPAHIGWNPITTGASTSPDIGMVPMGGWSMIIGGNAATTEISITRYWLVFVFGWDCHTGFLGGDFERGAAS